MQKTILVVDDDPHIREVILFALEKAGLRAVCAADGNAALEYFAKSQPSLIVLDISMPEMDGLEVCKTIRKTSQVPILFLSSRDDEIDRVVGLEIGGDDYVTKPFSPRELIARIHAILKRSEPGVASAKPPAPQRGHLRFDRDACLVYWKEQAIDLTATELELLQVLLRHPEKLYTRGELMDAAYRDVVVSDRTIDSHIRHIRKKFVDAGANDIIVTMHGMGYKLSTCQS